MFNGAELTRFPCALPLPQQTPLPLLPAAAHPNTVSTRRHPRLIHVLAAPRPVTPCTGSLQLQRPPQVPPPYPSSLLLLRADLSRHKSVSVRAFNLPLPAHADTDGGLPGCCSPMWALSGLLPRQPCSHTPLGYRPSTSSPVCRSGLACGRPP